MKKTSTDRYIKDKIILLLVLFAFAFINEEKKDSKVVVNPTRWILSKSLMLKK
jgi:hypothetical protein